MPWVSKDDFLASQCSDDYKEKFYWTHRDGAEPYFRTGQWIGASNIESVFTPAIEVPQPPGDGSAGKVLRDTRPRFSPPMDVIHISPCEPVVVPCPPYKKGSEWWGSYDRHYWAQWSGDVRMSFYDPCGTWRINGISCPMPDYVFSSTNMAEKPEPVKEHVRAEGWYLVETVNGREAFSYARWWDGDDWCVGPTGSSGTRRVDPNCNKHAQGVTPLYTQVEAWRLANGGDK